MHRFLILGLIFVLGCSSAPKVEESSLQDEVATAESKVQENAPVEEVIEEAKELSPEKSEEKAPVPEPELVDEPQEVIIPIATTYTPTEFEIEGTQYYRNLLSKYVKDGVVSYSGIRMSPSNLDLYLEALAKISEKTFEGWSEKEQMAYLINLYNATTLRLILDHYPVKGIRDIGNFLKGPWSQEVVSLFGENVTLDFIEHELLRKDYIEPRIHFALVCAAKSCPPLRSEPFYGEHLDAQLDEQGRIFLAQTDKNRIDHDEKVMYLSNIFKWFKRDFLKTADSLQAYAAPFFASEHSQQALEKYKVKYTDYDWALNGY